MTLPNLGLSGGPTALVELAVEAERAGWDGVFFWDTFASDEYDRMLGDDALRRSPWDVWTLLAAAASATERVRLGTLLTPLTRRRPWKFAAEAASVDRLSAGRLVVSAGLGWLPDPSLGRVGEARDRRIRAERLDEALEIATRLWSGKRVTHEGQHHSLEDFPSITPVQQPRVPIWVVGAWPREASMERALRYDGWLPTVQRELSGRKAWVQPEPSDLAAILADLSIDDGFDVVLEGGDPRAYADAGATWWLDDVWSELPDEGALAARVRRGPPD